MYIYIRKYNLKFSFLIHENLINLKFVGLVNEEIKNDLKIINQVFGLNDICGGCKEVEFSNVNSNSLVLKKGKYVLIPYTHIPLMQALEYTLCCQYLPGIFLYLCLICCCLRFTCRG
jgi:hypothetical protein